MAQTSKTPSNLQKESKVKITEWIAVIISLLTLIGTIAIQIYGVHENYTNELAFYNLQQNNKNAHLQLDALPRSLSSWGYKITNSGPASAQNVTIKTTIYTINPSWKKSITDISDLSPEPTPPALFGTPIYSKANMGPDQAIRGNNEISLPINDVLPQNGVVEVRFYFPRSFSQLAKSISGSISVFGDSDIISDFGKSPAIDDIGTALIDDYLNPILNVITLDTSVICTNCIFDSNYAKHNQLLTAIPFGGIIIMGSGYEMINGSYLWKRDIEVLYAVADPSEIPSITFPLNLRASNVDVNGQQQLYILKCLPTNCTS